MKNLLTRKLVVVLLSATCSVVQADVTYSYGDPTPAEQAHLEKINWARANPLAEAARLGIDVMEGVPSGAISGLPVPPLTMNALLSQAASGHSADMAARDYFAHNSPEGVTAIDRISNTGYDISTANENLAFVGSTVALNDVCSSLQMHDDLFFDEDFPNRTHRVNILSEDYKEVGISLAAGEKIQDSTSFNMFYITTNFGTSSEPRAFVLGVAYADKTGDGAYSVGEGIAGIEVLVVETSERTVTAGAGGYALPLSSGSYTLQFSHSVLGQITHEIDIGNDNIKLDILESEFTGQTPEIPATQANFDICTGVLQIPVVSVANATGGTDIFQAGMSRLTTIPPTFLFSLTMDDLVPTNPPDSDGAASFQATTATLHIPRVAVGIDVYAVDLQLVGFTPPFQFKLMGATPVQ